MRIGFSSVTIDCSTDFERFWQLSPDCVELCRVGAGEWPRAERFIRTSPVPVGLHCPLPFEGLMKHFEITGPDPGRQTQAIGLVERTLAAAASAGAAYVVVHFPTVFMPFNDGADRQLDPETYIEKALETARLLERMSRDSGVAILIENVGMNPYFYSSTHFRRLFECVPHLRMCLDPGHAHVLPIDEDVYTFTEMVAPFVSSVHFYNTNNRSDTKGYHYPPTKLQSAADGWMDLPRILKILSSDSPLDYLIFEYVPSADADEDAQSCARRARREIEDLPWPRFDGVKDERPGTVWAEL
jgi:sugar phosphate isomerase/epimerase